MTRDQAIEIARQRALNTREGHGYLPVTEADAATWVPHEWVIDSILWAAMQRGLAAIPTCTKCGYRVCHEDCGAEDYEASCRTAAYWKAEHLAGNAKIDQMRAEYEDLKRVAADNSRNLLAAKNEAETRELKAAQETDELRASIRQALGFAECSGGPNQMPNVVETLRRALGPNG